MHTIYAQTEIDRYQMLEDKCTEAIDRLGLTRDQEREVIAAAQKIIAEFAAEGHRMRLSSVRDRINLILQERNDDSVA